ncbi:MAG: RluA family pseudouridine synthase [Blastochloris sp.]|nr:RluA family pseudouridine synthase [Blastochloris sp.]
MDDVTLRYEWQAGDRGQRLDKVLALKWEVSRVQVQRWMDLGVVFLGEEKAEPRSRVKVGDVLVVAVPEAVPAELKPEDRPLEVLFEDAHFLVLNKAAGEVVHPGAGHAEGTLVAALLHHCRGGLSGIGGVERPGIVHRLDKDTSGLLLVAKTDQAHQNLSAQFRNRSIRKRYVALVMGKPRHLAGTWEGAIGRHPRSRQKMAIREDGKPARTDYRIETNWQFASKLELEIHTGRTHQIRVHCAAAGCPVLGDKTYGRAHQLGEKLGVERQMLHAWRTELLHPKTGKSIEFTAELPEDFRKAELGLEALARERAS